MVKRYYLGLDPGGATGTPCLYAAATNISGNPTYYQEQTNITGAAGATVTVQVTTLTLGGNTAGALLVNGSQVYLNNTFTVVLDGSGNGNFISRVQGDATQTGTAVRAVFSITGVSTGQLGTPSTHQISKAF